MRKLSVTLMEVLVAFVCFTLLVFFLFLGYVETKKMDIASFKLRKDVQDHVWAYQRLSSLFSSLIFVDKHSLFHTQEDHELYFTYDNGIDRDPYFSSQVQGRLFINTGAELTLETSSRLDPLKMRQEVLLTDALALNFLFDGNKTAWPEDAEELPKTLKISMMHQGREYSCAFLLLRETPHIQVH